MADEMPADVPDDMPDGVDFRNHSVTQVFIGIFMILMCIIFLDLLRKFYFNSKPKPSNVTSSSSTNVSVQSQSQDSKSNMSSTSKASGSSNKPKEILKFYKITCLVCIVFFIAAVAVDFGDGVYYFVTGIDVFHTDEYWLIALTNLLFGVSTISLYMFIFGRFYFAFKGSKYQLKKMTINIAVGLIFLNTFATVFYGVIYVIRYVHLSLDDFYFYLNISNIIILVADFALNFFILVLFACKLQAMFVDADCDIDGALKQSAVNASAQTIEDKMNIFQHKAVTAMTKLTILTGFAIIGNICFYISVIIGSNIQPIYLVDLWFLAYSNLIKAFHGVVVAFTMHLGFRFNNHLYYKFCNKYHFMCYHGFVRMTRKKVSKKVDQQAIVKIQMR